MASTPPTFVIQLTPTGRGAVAVVLVSGPISVSAVDAAFSPANGRPLDEQTIGRIIFGHWGVSTNGGGEELVACRRATDRVEVHPHGGVASVHAVIDHLVAAGCTRLDWKGWIARDEPDPIRAAARIALADAPTERTATILLDQYHGALRQAIDKISASGWCQPAGNVTDCEALLAWADLGRHLTRPWSVVLAGRPNVGKSSLANAILGYGRSITFDQPGTTRDVVTTTTAIDGWPIELSDTAGLREGGNSIEAAGVELAEHQLAEADLVVWIEIAGKSGERQEESRWWKAGEWRRTLCVVNKIDLLDPPVCNTLNNDADSNSILTSAKTGEGVPSLLAAISKSLVPTTPPPGTAVPFTEKQIEMLTTLAKHRPIT